MTAIRSLDVLVIGAGQAGLAIGYHLARTDMAFLLLDGSPEIGASWRTRWDSLRLFSPAQYDSLPGMAFPAPFDSHPTKDDVADYLAAYADRFALPVRLNTPVIDLQRDADGWFQATTASETLRARSVVVATGPFQVPRTPTVATGFSPDVRQLHSAQYRNPSQLAPGSNVLVVGAANSGLQIAAELAGRCTVDLATGSRPVELPQRLAGRDLFFWLDRCGFFTLPAATPLAHLLRRRGDLVIGGSRRRLEFTGVTLRPRLTGASGRTASFADGTAADFDAVVWATGYRSDYSWLRIPDVVVNGEVRHDQGRTAVPGLSFLGLPWQVSRGSALLGFVGRDAAALAARLTSKTGGGPTAAITAGAEPAQAR